MHRATHAFPYCILLVRQDATKIVSSILPCPTLISSISCHAPSYRPVVRDLGTALTAVTRRGVRSNREGHPSRRLATEVAVVVHAGLAGSAIIVDHQPPGVSTRRSPSHHLQCPSRQLMAAGEVKVLTTLCRQHTLSVRCIV